MRKLLKWWKGRRWVYLGYTEVGYVYTEDAPRKKGKKGTAGTMHFWAWANNMKHRKYTWEVVHEPCTINWYKRLPGYQTTIIPWLEGGDIWKPIQHPIAVQGDLINFYKTGDTGNSQP